VRLRLRPPARGVVDRAGAVTVTAPVRICPVCGISWAVHSPRCLCDYDFETGDPQAAIQRLGAEQRRGSRLLLAGALLLATLPVTIVAGVLYGAFVPAAAVCLVQLTLGPSLFLRGWLVRSAHGKQLAAAKALRRLPEARVIVR
jgi:hypothetical protein